MRTEKLMKRLKKLPGTGDVGAPDMEKDLGETLSRGEFATRCVAATRLNLLPCRLNSAHTNKHRPPKGDWRIFLVAGRDLCCSYTSDANSLEIVLIRLYCPCLRDECPL